MKFISKEELLNALARTYGDLTNERGCCCGERDRWLSIANIVAIINNCDEYDDQ